MFASLVTTPTRQQGAGENWKPSAQPVQRAENSCVFTTTETQREKGFFFSLHRLPILHLPFPSQPCGHKGSSISVNRIKCSIDPREPLNPSRHPLHWPQQSPKTPQPGPNQAQLIQDILLFSVRKILPSPVQTVQTTWGAVCYRYRGHLAAVPQNWTLKSVFEPDIEAFILAKLNKNPVALSCSVPVWFVCSF